MDGDAELVELLERKALLAGPLCVGSRKRVLFLAGPGGNNADGLRGGRIRVVSGHNVDIMIILPAGLRSPPGYLPWQ